MDSENSRPSVFEARLSDDVRPKTKTSYGSGPQQVFDKHQCSREKLGYPCSIPPVHLQLQMFDAAIKEDDLNTLYEDGTKQLAFLRTARASSANLLRELCSHFLIRYTSVVLKLKASGSYGPGAVFAPFRTSALGKEEFDAKYGRKSLNYPMTDYWMESWKRLGGPLFVFASLEFDDGGGGHATSLFFSSPSAPEGIYFDSNFTKDLVYQNQLKAVQDALASFGLSAKLAPCPRQRIQGLDHYCIWWSALSIFFSLCGVDAAPRTEILQDLGIVGLISFAKMVVDTLLLDEYKEFIDSTSSMFEVLPTKYPPLDLVPGSDHVLGVDRMTASFVSHVHQLRRAVRYRNEKLRSLSAPGGKRFPEREALYIYSETRNELDTRIVSMCRPLGKALAVSILQRDGFPEDILETGTDPALPEFDAVSGSALDLDSVVPGLERSVWDLTDPDLSTVGAELAVIRLLPEFLEGLYAAADGFSTRFARSRPESAGRVDSSATVTKPYAVVLFFSDGRRDTVAVDKTLQKDDFSVFNTTLIVRVIIPAGVIAIGDETFESFANLNFIYLPPTLVYIGYFAFNECYSLKSLMLPSSLVEIKLGAFTDCRSLTSIDIPVGVTEIDVQVFWKCTSLKTIHLPNSITKIGQKAFQRCHNLSNVSLPEQLSTIESLAFHECGSLASISFPELLTNIGNFAFSSCYNLKTVSFSEGLTTIGSFAFEDCKKIEFLVIPSSVTTIGFLPFYGCVSLKFLVLPEKFKNRVSDTEKGMDKIITLSDHPSLTSVSFKEFESWEFSDPPLHPGVMDQVSGGHDFVAKPPKRQADDSGPAPQRQKLE